MALTAPVEIDRDRVRELIEREGALLDERTPGSKAMYERARLTLAGGVASSYQLRDPWPIYVSHGEGERVWDVDENDYIDFHNGFGSMTQGHAHPAITAAVRERAALGTHFAAATEDGIVVAEELARRFRLPKWRYTNSGSEATMDAIRIARAHTGRDTVLKIFGSYHGHHDTVMVSIGVEYGRFGHREDLLSLAYGAGIPRCGRRHDDRRPVQRRRRDGAPDRAARRRRAPARVRDHGAGDDEPRGRAPRAGLSRGRARADRAPRDRPDLRRGQDGPDRRRRRRRRALRRRPRHGHAGEDARRRPSVRRDRRHGGGDGACRGRQRLPGRHVQREPAVDGRCAREPARGAHAGRVRPPRPSQRSGSSRAAAASSSGTGSPATRSGSARRAASRSHRCASSTTRRSRRTRTSS